MTTPNIVINMDAKCSNCGERGITGSGLCLSCATKALATDGAVNAHYLKLKKA